MAEDDADEEPAIALGDDPPVPGAPVGRVASRISWPRAKSDILAAEGETQIRTADGPRPLSELLDGVDISYFGRHQEFVGAIRDEIGYGPVAEDADEE